MAFEYITEEDLYSRYEDAKKYMLPLFEPFDEFERIARNRPHPGIDKKMPKVTDGTLAALIQEQPKRVIQRIPSGAVKANDRWLEVIAEYLLDHEIIPNSNDVASVIQKCWALTSKALTYGSQPVYVKFVNRGEYFGTDFTLPYIKDVLLEPGKLSDRDSNWIMMRAWYQPSDIEAIIKKEDLLTRNSQDRGDAEVYASGWDLSILEELKDEVKQKEVLNQTPQERLGKLNSKGYIEIVHCFQRGIGATFYSFSPALKQVVRRKQNPDPRGVMPIHYMYANVDLSNPLGRGAVEISGGMQNFLDSYVQSHQYMRALMINPPLKKRGTFSKSTIKYEPAAIWDMGADPNADIEPVKLESSSLQQFTTDYALIKSQILNLNSSTDTSVSSQAGNPGFSKTHAGVQATEQRLGISDQYMRNQFETLWEEVLTTELNLYFAERSGTQELTVDLATAEKLRELNPNFVNADNKVRIDYDTETPKLKFKVDPSSSKEEDNTEQIQALQEVLAETAKNPYIPYLLQADGKELHVGAVYEQLFSRFGLRDIDKIVTDIEKDPQTGQPKPPSVMTPFFDKPHLTAVYKDLPPKAQVQLLANGGVNVEENDVLQPNIDQIAGGRMQNPIQPAYVDPQTGQIMSGHPPQPGMPYVDPSTGQPVQSQPDDKPHPLIQVMTALDIKFTDLGPNAQAYVAQELLGVPADESTPSQVDQQIKASDAALRVAQAVHQGALAQHDSHLKTSDSALKVAQAVHTEQTAQSDANLKLAQQQQSAEQAAKAHELATEQAKQPTGVN